MTECDSCTSAVLIDVKKMDNALAWLKQQLQNITNSPGSLSNHLEANISDTKVPFTQVLNICVYELSFKTFSKPESLPKGKDPSPCCVRITK